MALWSKLQPQHRFFFMLPPTFITYSKGKGKVVPVHVVRAYMGSRVIVHSFLTSALDGDQWSTACPSHFTHGKEL